MSAPTGRSVPFGSGEREVIAAGLDDSDVLSIAAVRGGGRVYAQGPPELLSALAIEEQPTEFRGYGDPVALAVLMMSVTDWGCVEVEPEQADAVAEQLIVRGVGQVRRYGSLSYLLGQTVRRVQHQQVRRLTLDDLALLCEADPLLRVEGPETALADGVVVAGIEDGRLVARASCVARSARHGDIGVATLASSRGRGLATAAASEVASELQRVGIIPVWGTGETNWASQRVAAKLGFVLSGRRTYLIPAGRRS